MSTTKHEASREARWYMVDKDGAATLCVDEEDAKECAAHAFVAFPHMGPHRAVQLVEASTAGFTAADMATASAQGFRDGVASIAVSAAVPPALPPGWSLVDHGEEISLEGPTGERWRYRESSGSGTDSDFVCRFLRASLAASAGSEPMFWVRLCSDGLYEGPIHNARIEKVRKLSGAWSPLYLHPSPPEGAGWRPIAEAPRDGTSLLLTRKQCGSIADGFWRTDSATSSGSWIWAYVRKEPTHFKLRPAPPTSSADSRKGE